VVYINDNTGDLISGDLAGNSKRVIFKGKPSELPGWSPSRDFSMVFLHLYSKPGAPQNLAVVNIDGTGYREIAKLEGQPYCWPTWSWDNRYLLCTESQDEAQAVEDFGCRWPNPRIAEPENQSGEGQFLSGRPFRGISSPADLRSRSAFTDLHPSSRRRRAASGLRRAPKR
jgi:hypothetical protein